MFGIDSYPKLVFGRNFLRDIIFKVNYKETKSCTAKREHFIEVFKESYPIITDGIAQEIAITMKAQQVGQTISIKDDGDAHQVIMRSENAQKEFVLTNDFLQYKESGNTYENSADFNSQINKAIGFLNSNNANECKTLILRKINIVDFTSNSETEQEASTYQPLRELLAPHLLCMYEAFKPCNKFIKQNMYNLLLEEDDYALTIKYGYIVAEKNPTVTEIKGQIVIDLSLEKKGIFSIDILNEEIQKSHQELYNAFRWCISDKMLGILKQE